MSVIDVLSNAQYDSLCAEEKRVIAVYFWASWAPPCAQMDVVFSTLAQENQHVVFLRVEAEANEIIDKYDISSVPAFVFLKDNKVFDTLVGASAPDLAQKVAKFNTGDIPSSVSVSGGAAPRTAGGSASAAAEPLEARLEKLINQKRVMLFMKGNRDEPRCGFSKTAIGLLRDNNCTDFGTFDILGDEEVRAGLKQYSNWPTYPQLYVKGKLIGGLDIMKELAEAGELAQTVGPEEDLETRLKALTNKEKVMLFMKGNPAEPRCGFSKQCVAILQEEGVAFGTFDILQDEEVRQGLKEYSNWPTYPQLYVNGKLIGGLDIIKELKSEGELKDSLM